MISLENPLSGYLYKNNIIQSTAAAGQTALILFGISLAISLISSFGGNSLEMMWNFMNTLQLFYFLSCINVIFPANADQFFEFLGYANAQNSYLSWITFQVIPQNKFTRGTVNDRIGDIAFVVSSSDKIPILILITAFLIFVLIFDLSQIKSKCKFFYYVDKILTFFKYDFFIRFGFEIFLETYFNALVNLYFYDFSTKYEILSFSLATIFFALCFVLLFFLLFFVIALKEKIEVWPDKLEKYSCIFADFKHRQHSAVFFYIVFIVRRMIFATILIVYYHSACSQLVAALSISLLVCCYLVETKPYKHSIINKFAIFNEVCFIFGCMTLFFLKENKLDINESDSLSNFEYVIGWIFVVFICILCGLNFAFLLPIKIYESYQALKNLIKKLCASKTTRVNPKTKYTMKTHETSESNFGTGNNAMRSGNLKNSPGTSSSEFICNMDDRINSFQRTEGKDNHSIRTDMIYSKNSRNPITFRSEMHEISYQNVEIQKINLVKERTKHFISHEGFKGVISQIKEESKDIYNKPQDSKILKRIEEEKKWSYLKKQFELEKSSFNS